LRRWDAVKRLQLVYHADDHALIRTAIDVLDDVTHNLAENMMNTAVSSALKGTGSKGPLRQTGPEAAAVGNNRADSPAAQYAADGTGPVQVSASLAYGQVVERRRNPASPAGTISGRPLRLSNYRSTGSKSARKRCAWMVEAGALEAGPAAD